jgi:heme A synthase
MCLLLVSLAVAVVSHLIVGMVAAYRDGSSQRALLTWFRAMRVYAVLMAVNMALNVFTNGPNWWAMMLSVVGAAYLLYALVVFYRTVR